MSTVKGLFLMNLSVVGVILALGVYQVPQPWRGILVAWLLFLASAGVFVLRLLRHHYQYRKMKLEQKDQQIRGRRKEKKRGAFHVDGGLKVVHSDGGSGGRHTI
jgi:hypothetical protein